MKKRKTLDSREDTHRKGKKDIREEWEVEKEGEKNREKERGRETGEGEG